jgi:hypothetical protein
MIEWTKTMRAGRATYATDTPAGRVTIKHKLQGNGFRSWTVTFPDGKTCRQSTEDDALAYAEREIGRATAQGF